MRCEELTEKIIGVYYEVYNSLGFGFLEKVYENAIRLEFARRNIEFSNQVPIGVSYKGEIVGDYFADFVIGDVVVEIKAKKNLNGLDEAQLLNYLATCGMTLVSLRGLGKMLG